MVGVLLAIILPFSLIVGGLAAADTASGESSVPEPTRLEQTAAGQQADPSANAPTLPANPAGPKSPLPSPSPLDTASPLTSAQATPKEPGDTGIQSKTADSQPQTRAAYTVTFNDPDGNTSTPSQSVAGGGQASRPKDPSRDGYLFDGWFTGNTAVAYDFSQPVTGNITLTAKWTRITSSWALKPTSGPAEGGTRITLTTPTTSDIRFNHIDAGTGEASLTLGSDGNIYDLGYSSPKIITPSEEGTRFTQVGSGNGFFIALGSDGNLYSWGDNSKDQLGRTPTGATPADRPGIVTVPSGDTKFTQISVGFGHSLALDTNGNIYSWGNNDYGELGRTPTGATPADRPGIVTVPSGYTTFTQISGGTFSSFALDSDGNLYSWGDNAFGELGRDTNTQPADRPYKVIIFSGYTTFTQIEASRGNFFNLAIASDGNLYSWGNNKNGQLGRDTSRISASTISKVPMPAGVSRFIQASPGYTHSLALGSDGNLYSWGDNSQGQLGRDTGGKQDGTLKKVITPKEVKYVRTSAGGFLGSEYCLALGSDGNLYSWGSTSGGQLGRDTSGKFDVQPGMVNFPGKPKPTGVSFGGTAGTNLTANTGGTWSVITPPHAGGKTDVTVSWSRNGQQPDAHLSYTYISSYTVAFDSDGGKPTPDPQRITEGQQATRPTSSPAKDGFLFDGWFLKDAEGDSKVAYDFSQPVTGNITLVAHWSPADTGGWSISPSKGNVMGGQQATITPPKLSRGIRFNQVSAGGYEIGRASGFSVGVASDGNAYAWGSNQYGQLGQGSTSSTPQKTPVRVPLPAGVDSNFTYTQAMAGGKHVLAIGSDGIVYAWGANDRCQLGDNTTGHFKPQPIKGADGQPFKAVQVSAGAYDSAAIDPQGRVYTWGSEYNSGGSYSLSRSTPTLVQDPNGSNEGLQAVQVAVKWSFIMALDKKGTIYAWGYNDYGQLGNGTSDSSYTNQPTPVQYPGKTGQPFQAKQISAGSWSALAIDTTDTVWAWGWNNRGQLGNGSTANRQYSPVRVQDPTGTNQGFQASQICTGTNHTLAIDKEGTAWAWGDNGNGRLGNGTVKNARTPTQIKGFLQQNNADAGFKAARISAGSQHSLAIGQDGNAYSWGDNQYGQLGTGNDTAQSSNPTPVPFNSLLITGVSFDKTAVSSLQQNADGSVTLATPAHSPGQADVIVDWTLGGISQTQARLAYTYEGVLPLTGGNGSMIILLAAGLLATAGAAAAGRHRRETRSLHA